MNNINQNWLGGGGGGGGESCHILDINWRLGTLSLDTCGTKHKHLVNINKEEVTELMWNIFV